MKLSFSPLALVVSLSGFVVAAGCSATSTSDDAEPGSTSTKDGGKGSEEERDGATAEPEVPHALGSIVLGESHSSSNRNQSSPIVSASFVPNAAQSSACGTEMLAGCEVQVAPTCNDADGQSRCESGEYCGWSDACKATCLKAPSCDKACDEDEVCKLDPNGKADKCVRIDTFDAGPLAFSGTTTAITLFPPYTYESDSRGAPFLAGSKLRVQAQGASAAGFAAFEEDFTATTFIQTSGKISRMDAFGSGDLPLRWVAGTESIEIGLTGRGGSATCKAVDAEGSFSVPRAVLDAVTKKPKGENSTPSLNVRISRERTEIKKDKKVSGDSVNGVAVIADGWLKLQTISSETTSLSGCSSGGLACTDGSDECVDGRSDPKNCGACGNVCSNGKVCAGGACATKAAACDTCVSAARTDACASQVSTCQASAECTTLNNCYSACTTQGCADACWTDHPDGQYQFQNYLQCVQSACGQVCAD